MCGIAVITTKKSMCFNTINVGPPPGPIVQGKCCQAVSGVRLPLGESPVLRGLKLTVTSRKTSDVHRKEICDQARNLCQAMV